MPRDQKVMILLPTREKCSMDLKELFLLPEFDNSSPSATRDKEIC